MPASKPKISVIVCTYNRENLLEGALNSLATQTLDDSQYEVLVVDNNSTDGTKKLAEEFARHHNNFHVSNEPRQGLSHARNRGWRVARGDYIAYIDDDAKAAQDWCEKILNAFESLKPEPTAVGGQIHPWYEGTPPDWFSDDLEIRTWGDKKGWLPTDSTRFSGSNMAFPRRVLEENGGFSSEFGVIGDSLRMGEDAEFFNRLSTRESFFWYDPEIQVKHWVPVHKYRWKYRFKRSYEIGKAASSINESFGKPKFYLLLSIAKNILFSPAVILKKKYHWKYTACKIIQNLGMEIGMLRGSIQSNESLYSQPMKEIPCNKRQGDHSDL